MDTPASHPALSLRDLPLAAVHANRSQPRTVFDEDALAELAASIAAVGLLQPVVVRPGETDGTFELVAGERRLRACQLLNLPHLPALVRHTDDADMLREALVENLQRVALNAIEEGGAYQQMTEELSLTHEQVAAAVGKSRSHVSHMIALLRLPAPVQRRVAAGVLSAGHAKVLLGLRDPHVCARLAERIVAEGLSVRTTAELVTLGDLPGLEQARTARPLRATRAPDPLLDEIAEELGDLFDTRVRVDAGRERGRIVLEFAGREDLHRLLEVLAPLRAGMPAASRAG